MISDEAVEAAARGIKAAQCFGREGPFGRYDYTSYGWEKPHRVRDFRDPKSETWGADVYKSDDAVACELEYERLTEQHIARAALEAALPHLLASQGCGTGHSGEQLEPAVGATAALAQELPEGFTAWHGGECPVPGETVEWINARGHRNTFRASDVSGWDWHDPRTRPEYEWRIVGYRVVPAHPQKGGEG